MKGYSIFGRNGLSLGMLTVVALLGANLISNQRYTGNCDTPSRQIRRYEAHVIYSTAPAWGVPRQILEKISQKNAALSIGFSGPTDADAGKQIEEMESAIQRKVDGLIVVPSDEKVLSTSIKQAISCGIPVVTLFNDISDSKRAAFISSAEKKSAQILTDKLAAEFKQPQHSNKVLELLVCITNPILPLSRQRLEGVNEALKAAPWIKLVKVVSNQADDAKSAEVVAAALTEFPNIKIIIGLDSRAAIGAISVFKERGISKGEIVLSAWDSDQDVLQAIKDGWIQITSAPNIGYMFQLALSILETQQLEYDLQINHSLAAIAPPVIVEQIDIPQNIITRDNVSNFFNS